MDESETPPTWTMKRTAPLGAIEWVGPVTTVCAA